MPRSDPEANVAGVARVALSNTDRAARCPIHPWARFAPGGSGASFPRSSRNPGSPRDPAPASSRRDSRSASETACVRLWLRRCQQEGKPGLNERSRAPHHIPHQTPPEVEQRVLEARDAIPCFGPQRLKEEFGLPCSTGAIGRILRRHGRRGAAKSRARRCAAPLPVHRPHGAGRDAVAGLQCRQ
jgi:hypothetical protein